MTLQHVDMVFQLITFLFAISFHESAHAWMANRCGDPTARMLGRITLNPIKHIDPIGTVAMPLIAMLTGIPVLGWAKPTPVNPSNCRNEVLDDILTSVVGPISNFLLAAATVVLLVVVILVVPGARPVIHAIVKGSGLSNSPLFPVALLFYELLEINIVLGVFNLIPVPPLDGSHVLRHFMPDSVRRVYDTVGMFGLFALVYFGPKFLASLIRPVLAVFDSILLRV